MFRLSLCAIVLLTSCQNINGLDGDTSDPFVGCRDYVRFFVNQVRACPGSGGIGLIFTTDGVIDAGCKSLAAEVKAGNIRYDRSQLEPCAAALQSLACDLSRTSLLPPACARLFIGTIAPGGACTSSFDCAAGKCTLAVDAMGNSTCPGVCVALTPVGGACTKRADCQIGLNCPAHQCTDQPVAPGGPCNDQGDCAPGTHCHGQCVADVATGGACTGDEQCFVGGLCLDGKCSAYVANGGSCSQGTVTCASDSCRGGVCVSVEYVQNGQACGAVSSASALCNDGYCRIAASATTGVCVPFLTEGTACDPGGDLLGLAPECIPGLICDKTARTCVAKSPCSGL